MASSGEERDRAAFAALYRAHGSAMLAYFRRRLAGGDADDAVADVFEIAWRRFESIPDDDGRARAWLYGVARNVLHNRVRSKTRRRRLETKLGGQAPRRTPDTELQVVRRLQDQIVLEAVMRLPEKYRETLILAEWDGLPREQIADLMGVSRAAIDQRISRAYKRLGRLVDVQQFRTPDSRSPLEPERGGRE
jgi:RNA polymerase sigma-70 factor (ECF subfamily)